jgi:hypothetical protein
MLKVQVSSVFKILLEAKIFYNIYMSRTTNWYNQLFITNTQFSNFEIYVLS